MRRTFILFLILMVVLPLVAQEIIDVSVQGLSDGIKNDKRQDRDEAIMDAKLQAIEKAGVNFKTITQIEDFTLKYDLVESKADACLMPGFQIIESGYGEDGIYGVVLEGKIRTIPLYVKSISSTNPAFETVTIGSQIWSAVNLNIEKFQNGDPIPEARSEKEWLNAYKLQQPAWCYYENDTKYGKIYGKLYNWYAVSDARNIAPEGWHVPTDDEWKQLEIYLGMTCDEANEVSDRGSLEGGKLKEVDTEWYMYNYGATDETGFSALPGGYRFDDGSFRGLGVHASFWTATAVKNDTLAWFRYLSYGTADIARFSTPKHNGFSVRCVKD